MKGVQLLRNIISFVFFGNVFYAACTVALCIETNLLAGLPLNSFYFYLLIASATVCFYGLIYYKSGNKVNLQLIAFDRQSRLLWYASHKKFIRFLLYLGIFTIILAGSIYFLKYFHFIKRLSFFDYFFLFLFPFVSVAYSYRILPFKQLKILRSAGTLKPFILGFAWAGFVTLFPYIAVKWEGKIISSFHLPILWLFIQNFIFISLLCILFDIKDEKNDARNNLKTIPVKLGVSKTIYFVILPLVLVSIASKLLYFLQDKDYYTAVFLRTIPHLILIWAALNVRKPKSTLYYLAVIDGLMLLKAFFGVVSIFFYKL